MTTTAEFPGSGPRMHALVIGVGRYPRCEAGNFGTTTTSALARRFGPLSSPPRSARTFADWLIRHQPYDPVAPLGSVELLASGPPDDAEAPTFANVVAAFDRWYARCDEDERNIAMFFFSGHGCGHGYSQNLLLEDIGGSELRFFENAIRFDRTYLGMARCRARTQCYLVDACRDIPYEVRDLIEPAARTLIEPHVSQPARDAPIIYAAAPGERARGHEQDLTRFTRALLDALDGLAAQPDRDRWTVTTHSLGQTIGQLLNRDAPPGLPWQQPTTDGGTSWRTPLRQLSEPPRVPFRLGCDPGAALPAAEMRIVRPGWSEPELRRPPSPSSWEGSIRAAFYSVEALFRGAGYKDTVQGLWFMPPYLEHALPVEPA